MCFPALMLSYIRSASLQRKRDDDEVVLRDVMRQVLPGAIRSGTCLIRMSREESGGVASEVVLLRMNSM